MANLLFKMFTDIFRKALDKGLFHLVFANLASSAILFVSHLIVVKFIGPTELGQIKIIQSINAIAILIGGFGFSAATLKICSDGRSLAEARAVLKKIGRYLGLSVGVALVLFFFLAVFKLLSVDSVVNKWYLVYILILPAVVYRDLFLSYLKAIKKVKVISINQFSFGLIHLIILPLFAWQWGMPGIIFGTLLSSYINLLIAIGFVGSLRETKDKTLVTLRQIFGYAKWGFLGNVTYKLAVLMDIIFLNYLYKDRAAIGYYSLAIMIIAVLDNFPYAISSISTPYFSALKKKEHLFYLLYKYGTWVIVVNLTITLSAFVAVPRLIGFIYGVEYVFAGLIFQILIFKYLFWSSYSLISASIFGLGKIKYNFYSAVMILLFSVVGGYYGLVNYGILGLAISQVVAQFLAMLVSIFLLSLAIKKVFADDTN